MHPPFIFTDHRVSPQHYEKPLIKRGAPARLDLTLPSTGWPPIPLPSQPPQPFDPVKVRLQIVPAPRNTLRDVIGRFLIRTGQRMILTNRPG